MITDDRFVQLVWEMGKIATSLLCPGLLQRSGEIRATFREVNGVRALSGDYATVEADGTITLLGRGSACINTGGEKVFPEEVEEAVKRHPLVADCLVVGLPDERFGQRVVAVTSLKENTSVSAEDVIAFTADHLAGYKLPKQVLLVPQVRRAPNGKAGRGKGRCRAGKSGHGGCNHRAGKPMTVTNGLAGRHSRSDLTSMISARGHHDACRSS